MSSPISDDPEMTAAREHGHHRAVPTAVTRGAGSRPTTHHVETIAPQSERTVFDAGAVGYASSPSARAAAFDGLPSWRGVLAIVTASLALATLLVSGLLNFGYERFYQALGVRPADVGLSFGVALGRSAGLIVVLAGATALVAVTVRVLLAGPRRR